MGDRIKHKLGSSKSVESVNTDFQMGISLEAKQKLLPSTDINKVLDVGEVFNNERQSSSCYRLLGTIKTLFSNVLFDVSASNNVTTNTLASFNRTEFRDKSNPSNSTTNDVEDLTFIDSARENLVEQNGWFGFINPDKLGSSCNFLDMSPGRELFELTPKNNVNWGIKITYPFEKKQTPGDITDGGLLIINLSPGVIGDKPVTLLYTPVKHNLSPGDSVRISGLVPSAINNDYTVQRIGDDTGNLKDYVFVINTNPNTTTLGINPRMSRIVAGEQSTYYFRMFKSLTIDNDYEMYQLAFAKTLFTDKVPQFTFNNNIDVSGLVDNLGRPLSELYLTFIKTDNNGFSVVKSGLDMPNISAIGNNTKLPDIRRIHNGPTPVTHKPLEPGVKVTDTLFYGDVAEYNKFEVKETILGEVNHRFNRILRDTPVNIPTGTNLSPAYEGYFYKAHHIIQIRHFSNYIEQGDATVIGIPDYAEYLPDGRILWRDLLSIGFNDGYPKTLDYPFLNGCHYIHQNYCLNLRRQDPFNNFGLFYDKPPFPPVGVSLEENNITVNNGGDDC